MARQSFTPSAPSQIIWIIALIVGILGLIGSVTSIDFVTANSFTLVAVGFLLLLIGTSLKGI